MSISSLINANTHRVKEGARVLEDVARFVLRDETLFLAARELRHGIHNVAPLYKPEQDFAGSDFPEDNVRLHLLSIVQANAARIQEALRVLEEFSNTTVAKENYKRLRFFAYELQQAFYLRSESFLHINKLRGLYIIVDDSIVQQPLSKMIAIINQSDVNLIQYRNKTISKQHFLQNVLKIKSLLDPKKLLIINDYLEIALDVGDGVHLGQTDYPLVRARQLLSGRAILGVTCHNISEAQIAVQKGASYISVGCVFETKSKADVITTSIEQLAEIRANVHRPLAAIGGIDLDNSQIIAATGVDMICMLSAIWQQSNPLAYIHHCNSLFK